MNIETILFLAVVVTELLLIAVLALQNKRLEDATEDYKRMRSDRDREAERTESFRKELYKSEERAAELQDIISAIVRQHGQQHGDESKQLTYRYLDKSELITKTITRQAEPEIQ